MKSTASPFRYPGGKAKLIPLVRGILRANNLAGCHFYELFAGGSALSLGLLFEGTVSNVTLLEKDPLLYSFWKAATNSAEQLCEKIEKTSISLSTWKYVKNSINNMKNLTTIEKAFAALFLNRTNFSGILNARPIGGMKQLSDYKIDCRFNKAQIISQILEIRKFGKLIEVRSGSALDYLANKSWMLRFKRAFVYLDPPYFEKGDSLYRYYFGDKDHLALATLVRSAKYPLMLSYDDTFEIRKLYAGLPTCDLELNYEHKRVKRVREFCLLKNVVPSYQAIVSGSNSARFAERSVLNSIEAIRA